ncbi:hypothetical protein [Caecibacteroides pullorum]|uniref:Uncharacterized protein n=1 Tax=Caecibacteroides pullorum TaxID=2725562 RepID=A0AA40ZRU9_9BACT|nr:hypothetical protein [Caecibacteroides pullorum]MBM6856619.1 hypothetical protein [Caecibacteroides pullorum]MBV8057625.1 hypothetical protein [Caecibacteroides pullorum]
MISIILIQRRFRRKLKSRKKKHNRNKGKSYFLNIFKEYRKIGKNIHSYQEALNTFLPKNLAYLTEEEKSPFYINKLKQKNKKNVGIHIVPKHFSIIENSFESIDFLRSIIESFIFQTYEELWLDYRNCENVDLPTQVFLDSILLDIDEFIKTCKKANVYKFVRLASIGGRNINNQSVIRLLYSVGSPVELINKQVRYNDIIPYKLRRFDEEKLNKNSALVQKEIDTTTLLDYVNSCLSRVKKTLSREASMDLGYVIGETLINAEEHSSLKCRYLIGYFEECNKDGKHFGLLNLVIMNFGQTIYEKFKYPIGDNPINEDCLHKMKIMSDKFRSHSLFKKDKFTEETLWTLYSLQGGVSCIPREIQQRGNGTIQFINSFFKLKGDENVDNISKMFLLSGNTRIDFDGTYKLVDDKDENGSPRGVISFNKTGKLTDAPDEKYVRNVPDYFPGTIIFAKLSINDDDLNNE